MAAFPAIDATYSSPAALEFALRAYGASSDRPLKLNFVSSDTQCSCTCQESPSCSFTIKAQRVYSAAGPIWRITQAEQKHHHPAAFQTTRPPLHPQQFSYPSAPVRAAPTPYSSYNAPMHSAHSALPGFSLTALPAPRRTLSSEVPVRPNATAYRPPERAQSLSITTAKPRHDVLMPKSPSQILLLPSTTSIEKKVRPVPVPIVTDAMENDQEPREVPPVPKLGSVFESREAFKDACNAHAEASRPRFGFATSGSNNTGAKPFLLYACRHNGGNGRRKEGCPYAIRAELSKPSKSDSPWVVTWACYTHEKHQVPSPPFRKGAWTKSLAPAIKRKRGPGRPPKAASAEPQQQQKKTPSVSTGAGEESDAEGDGEEDSDESEEERPIKRTTSPQRAERTKAALDSIAATSAAAMDAKMSPVKPLSLDTSRSISSLFAELHPLWTDSPSTLAETHLASAGVDSTTLSTLTIDEVIALLKSTTFNPAQLAILRHRLGARLSLDPAGLRAPRPGRKPSTLAGALVALHPTIFPRDDTVIVAGIEATGITDADALKSLNRQELTEVLAEAQGLTEVQKVVIAHRVADL